MSIDPRLLDVAACDAAIDALERRLAELPEARALEEATAARDASTATETELADKHGRAERDAKRLDDEGATLDSKLTNVNRKLHDGSVTNPRELAALQAEQEMLGRKRGEVEDLQLELMMLLEDLEAQLARAAEERDAASARFDVAAAAHSVVVGEIEAELEAERGTRAGAAAGIDSTLLGTYDKVRRRSGIGAAALNGDVCSACHMKLTAPEVTEVEAAQTGRCPSCDVILVIVT